ncbi:MAG TPA: hypothetical protein DCF33_18860 [Saprospirales bacterium]|nr:hypothetical protein [Saprospirales bacterium]
MKPKFFIVCQVFLCFFFLVNGDALFAQKEPAPCNLNFTSTEVLEDCKLKITFSAVGCLECTHTWNIGQCGNNQILNGTTVSYFVSNIDVYQNPEISVLHNITCTDGTTSGVFTYTITTQGIFLGRAGDFSAVIPATTLLRCNDNQPLLNDLVSQKNVFVLSRIQIDKPNQAFNNCNVCMDPGTGFIVGQSTASTNTHHLNIKNNSFVHNAATSQISNSPIWQSIDVERTGNVQISDSRVKGALIAVRVKHANAAIKLSNTIFENNFISLASSGHFVNNGISGNTFKGPQNAFFPMAPNFPALSLDAYITDEIPGLSYSTVRPFSGIFLENSILVTG